MYRFDLNGFPKKNLVQELINEFLPPSSYSVTPDGAEEGDRLIPVASADGGSLDEIKREVFDALKRETGDAPAWGILTGVRPVKLCGELLARTGSAEEVRRILCGPYRLSENKADLLLRIYGYQQRVCGEAPADSAAVYLGIPFCPTRCLYCSFASNQVKHPVIEEYLTALKHEVGAVGAAMRESGWTTESLYFGGGTPTTLTASELDDLIGTLEKAFDLSALKEFTVEAGRPDTIDREKLRVLKDHGVGRISINPQSMNQHTLDLIGRSHSPKDIERAFEDALAVGFDSINADIIAGLPEEELPDLLATLEKVISLGADNVTVHSLAVKRASRLIEVDPDYHYKQGKLVQRMVAEAADRLAAEGFVPYYLYRQKHMAGACENTGYCRDDRAGLYNVRIMDEHQSVVAMGAGGISKIYFPAENRLERVPNVTDYRQYIDRIDEMLERKYTGLFSRGIGKEETC